MTPTTSKIAGDRNRRLVVSPGLRQRPAPAAHRRSTRWKKAPKLKLSAGMSVDDTLDSIIDNCLTHLVANAPCVQRASNPEGLHQMRVAIRRLRSALKLFRKRLPGARHLALDAELKWLANVLGGARDLDVLLAEVFPLARAAIGDSKAFVGLEDRALRRRAAAYRRVSAVLVSDRYAALTKEIARWRTEKAWRAAENEKEAKKFDQPLGRVANRLLAKAHRRTVRRGRHFRNLDPAGRHGVRIAAKRLRYASDFFGGLYGREAHERYLGILKRLQDDLGRANDLAMSERLLNQLLGRNPAPEMKVGVYALLEWQRRDVLAREPLLVESWRAFEASTPFWRDGEARRKRVAAS